MGGAGIGSDWRDMYLGIIDYSAIILWVMENAELAAVALLAGTTTAAGVGVGTVGALGAIALGATGPAAIAGLTAAAAVGAVVVGGVAADKTMAKDALKAANNLGEDYKVILQEEPFKSTTTPLEVFDALKNQTVDLLLIAHPTQSIRRSLLQKHGRIRNNLTHLYAKDITPDDKQELDEALQREMREEDEEIEADGANYQLEMMRCF